VKWAERQVTRWLVLGLVAPSLVGGVAVARGDAGVGLRAPSGGLRGATQSKRATAKVRMRI
jgi:hypothetical protein